jgi:hypothetical protein
VPTDAGQVDDDREARRILRPEAIDLRPEAAPQPGEGEDLPEVGEELLDLLGRVLDVAAFTHRSHSTPLPRFCLPAGRC